LAKLSGRTVVNLRRFESRDAGLLAKISKRAFENDVQFGAPARGGPPGYDAPEWQAQVAREATAYYVIEHQGDVVGGMIVFGSSGDYWLGRMFVDPTAQNQGIGARAIDLLEGEFPEAKRWALETPQWNTRNHRFYEKLGYARVGLADSGDYLYEKCVTRSI
jgi:GNAT superfamily N-acetyltransferase